MLNRSQYSVRHSMMPVSGVVDWTQRGVEAVELAIILPVFLALMFGAIDVARLVSAYSAVRTASALGARQAVGLQRPDWVSVTAATGGASTFDVASGTWSDWEQVPSLWNGALPGDVNNYKIRAQSELNISSIYKLEVRAIAYANTILTDAVGQISYPCRDTAGCAMCFTIRGEPELFQKFFSIDTGGGTRYYAANILAMECRYDVPISAAVVALGWLPDFITVSARVYVPVNNYTGAEYDGGSS